LSVGERKLMNHFVVFTLSQRGLKK
jgi:hypothetical protein